MAARKPRVEYYWSRQGGFATESPPEVVAHVNWRLVGANGETMCQSTQGYRDKTDARRAVDRVAELFTPEWKPELGRYGPQYREVGPGRKPS